MTVNHTIRATHAGLSITKAGGAVVCRAMRPVNCSWNKTTGLGFEA